MAEDTRKNRILEIDRAEMSPLQLRIQEQVDTWKGRGATPFKIWQHCPEVAEGMEVLASHLRGPSSSLSNAERELIVMATVVFWGVDYAITNHLRHARNTGLDATALDKIVAKQPASFSDPRLQAVYELASAALTGDGVADEAFARFEKILGRRGIAEVLALIGFYTSISLGLKVHGV